LSAWSSSGITDVTGRPLPALDIDASVLVPSGQQGPAFVVYRNFDVIMRWNRSEHFALTVGHLADRIAGGAALSKPPPSGPRIERSTVAVLQRFLSSEGYDPGPADGIFGARSRAALRALQSSRGLVADGFLSVELLRQLRILSN
jgi:membrane-bound lytic murein transglycosylase B